MAGITLAQAEAKLAEYLDAESKILQGQTVRMADRQLTRADLEWVQKGIDTWDRRVQSLAQSENNKTRARTIAPRW